MKSFLLTLLLPVLINGSVIKPRQFPGNKFLPKLKALKVEELPSKLGVLGAKRVKITYGPYKIKGTKVSSEFVLPVSA